MPSALLLPVIMATFWERRGVDGPELRVGIPGCVEVPPIVVGVGGGGVGRVVLGADVMVEFGGGVEDGWLLGALSACVFGSGCSLGMWVYVKL